MSDTTTGEQLRRLREERGLTQAALAARTGVPQAYLSQIEKGYRQPGEELAERVLVDGLQLKEAEARALLREWRLVKAGLPAGLEKLAETDFVAIPILGNVPAGPPREVHPDTEGYLSLPTSQVNSRHRLFSIRADGLSMVEEGIVPGDLLVVDQDISVQHGEIAVVRVGGQVTLKRVFFRDQFVELRPANSQMKAMQSRDVEFVGKVIAHVRRF